MRDVPHFSEPRFPTLGNRNENLLSADCSGLVRLITGEMLLGGTLLLQSGRLQVLSQPPYVLFLAGREGLF